MCRSPLKAEPSSCHHSIMMQTGLDSRAKCNGLCEPDLHVFAKLFEGRQERGLETQAFANISA
jgi:hypothetical protein